MFGSHLFRGKLGFRETEVELILQYYIFDASVPSSLGSHNFLHILLKSLKS